MEKETKCIQSGYAPNNGDPRVLPIVQSTTFQYDSTQHVGDLFDLKANGYFYTRLANPTVSGAEAKLNDLDGGVGAMMTASGQSASMIAFTNLAGTGDHVVASSEIYGGTFNLLAVTLRKLGIETTFVNINNLSEVEKAIRPNTKFVFGETLANPALSILDISAVAEIAHKHGVPLMVDNTFATPVLCRPIEFGADIVIYSSSKYLDGHAVALGGMIVDGGTFDWKKSGRFDGLVLPDPSYHGVSYVDTFAKSAFIMKARLQLMRDMGCMASPMNAFLTNLGMETLHLRMPRHSENAQKVAEFLAAQKCVKRVKYPGLKSDPDYARGQKYMDGACSGVISFELATREDAVRFMDSLQLAKIVVHVADARTGVLHPASSTHRQLSDAQLAEAGISPGMIRFSTGLENANDILADVKQALEKI